MALLQQLHNRSVVTTTLLLALVALATSPRGASGGDPAAGAALIRFQAAADLSSGGGKALTWPDPSADPVDPCKFKDRGWAGVSCDAGDKVFAVSVAGRRLGGTVPNNTLGAIPGLTNLTLAGTALTGLLPPDLTQHRALRSLVLTGNRLGAGGVPQFPNARNLTVLVLADAGLAGAVPDFLQSAPVLARLDVSGNPGLTGPVPPGLQRFGASAFADDDGLCGPPTPHACDEYGGGGGRRRKKGLSTAEITVIILADIFVLVLVTAGCYVCYSRRSAPDDDGKKKKKSKGDADAMERGGGGGGGVKEAAAADGDDAGAAAKNKLVFVDGRAGAGGGGGGFDLEDLLRASAEMLGKGSLGTAYKAVLAGGAEVAVKRLRDLRDAGPAGRKDFEAAMEAVGKLRHPNLVPLKAYYYAREEKLLVYEYQPTGSLYTLLHENRQSPDRVPLDWATRLRCALGVARGLHHLHHGHHPGAPHGNIKSTNILMDANLEPRITDYGLAPLTAPGAATACLAAYRAPEYANLKHRPGGGGLPLPLTHKADVYSFGVLLLELLTGRVPAQSVSAGVAVTTAAGTIVDPGIDLPRWVHSVVREEWTAEVFDLELMAYSDIEEEMVGLLQVAMKCVVAQPDQRPSMGDVVKQVEEIRGPDPYADHDGEEEEEGDEEDYTTDFSSEMSFTTGAATATATAQRGAGAAGAQQQQPAPQRL